LEDCWFILIIAEGSSANAEVVVDIQILAAARELVQRTKEIDAIKGRIESNQRFHSIT